MSPHTSALRRKYATLKLGTRYPCPWAVCTGRVRVSKMTPVSTAREHGLWTRAVCTRTEPKARYTLPHNQHGCPTRVSFWTRVFARPCTRAPVHTSREYSPCRRPVNTGTVYRAPVSVNVCEHGPSRLTNTLCETAIGCDVA